MLPGWYGTGQALSAFKDRGLLQEMAATWPFFQSDARQPRDGAGQVGYVHRAPHAALGADRALADGLFRRIETAWHTTHDLLLDITGQTRLLEKHPALDASIRLRLPYIEPLNLLQVELLKRHRAGETDARVREGIQLSINAVATALRNSG